MLKKILDERKIPALMKMNDGTPVTAENWRARRAEILDILEKWEYGRVPKTCGETVGEVISKNECAEADAVTSIVNITFPTPDGESFTFPVVVTVPNSANAESKVPALVFISFNNKDICSNAELVKKGVILAEFNMNKVATDNFDNWDDLISAHYIKDGKRKPDDFGKFGMWAFAASRVLDYILTFDCVDKEHVGVIGHSRLGKTALWAGAVDERFTHVFPNNSGCSGTAITRGKTGETFPFIYEKFGYWFCENMKEISTSIEVSESTDFDQHFLVAACAPRKICMGTAKEDTWADPISEYLSCVAASPAWEILGMTGFVHPDRLPEVWDTFEEGNVGYHLRDGGHNLSNYDWDKYIEFLKK